METGEPLKDRHRVGPDPSVNDNPGPDTCRPPDGSRVRPNLKRIVGRTNLTPVFSPPTP